jgi:tetratricopeptide (TPR) repeat protein
MHRRIPAVSLFLITLCGCFLSAVAQESNQSIPVTMPPTRRIEPPPPDAAVQDLDERGDQLRAEKAYLDAIDYFQAALKKLPPKDARAAVEYNKIGITQLRLARYYDARKNFERAVKINPKYAFAFNNLAVANYLDKKYGRAVKYYRRAIEMDPDNASFHNNLGSAYFAKKDLDKAVAEYGRALQLDPDIFERRSDMGIVAQTSSPEDRAHFSYVLAKMYAQQGHADRALLYLRRAMEEGYKDIKNVYQDEEFAKLRKDERFISLMAQPPMAIP